MQEWELWLRWDTKGEVHCNFTQGPCNQRRKIKRVVKRIKKICIGQFLLLFKFDLAKMKKLAKELFINYFLFLNRWACDGEKLPGGCLSGFKGFNKTNNAESKSLYLFCLNLLGIF